MGTICISVLRIRTGDINAYLPPWKYRSKFTKAIMSPWLHVICASAYIDRYALIYSNMIRYVTLWCSDDGVWRINEVKAKFHYASYFGAGSEHVRS